MSKVLMVNHGLSKVCGVYQHGKRAADIAMFSHKHQIMALECDSEHEFRCAVAVQGLSDIVIYNYHPHTLGWAAYMHQRLPGIVHVGTMHEGTYPDALYPPDHFPFWIWHDPSLKGMRSLAGNMFPTVRPLPYLKDASPLPPHFTKEFGTFGFAFRDKKFENVAAYAKEKGAFLRVHMPCAHFGGDPNHAYADALRDILGDDGTVSTNFLSEQEMLLWLARNDENVLMYDLNTGRGISSASDFAVACGRPLTLNDSSQFRHIHHFFGYDGIDHPIPKLKTYDTAPLRRAWHPDNFVKDMEEIIDALGRIGA